MFVVSSLRHLRVARPVVLLACLLVQQQAMAGNDDVSISFRATRLIGAVDTAAAGAGADTLLETASFAAFEPLPDATSIRTQIASLEEAGDYYAPRIAELSVELGKVLQAEGEHRAALAAFDRGFQVTRRNEGLFSAAQAAILQEQVASHVALGDFESSDALQQSRFTMQQRLYAEQPAQLAEAHVAAANWNLKYYLWAQQPARSGLGTDAQDEELARRLGTALGQYHQALWLLESSNPDGKYDAKVAIEQSIAALTLMVDRQYQRDYPATLTLHEQRSIHQSRQSHNSLLFSHGSAALQRAVAHDAAGGGPVRAAQRQLELADWYLLMDRNAEARATYAAAMAAFRNAGLEERGVTAMLESGLPVHDPEAALRALVQDQPAETYEGYIDVAFDVDTYGKASNARVIAGARYDEQVEEVLLRQIQVGRFRPGFAQESPVALNDVTLRYYYARQVN